VADTPRRLEVCRKAILKKDFESFADIIELDSDMMHAVMMTSSPPLSYWQAGTVEIFHQVREWRAGGLPVCYTVDAGSNVHVLCLGEYAKEVEKRLSQLPNVRAVLIAGVGGGAQLV
jgi:diphosphomevalonate decarboxylase